MRRSRFLMLLGAVVLAAGCGDDGDGPTYRRPRPGPPDLAVIATPSSVAASPVSTTEIAVTWKVSASQIDGVELFRSTTGSDGTFVLVAGLAASATSYADVQLSAATNYCYELRSFRTIGRKNQYSSYSNVACATTLAPPVRAPLALNAIPVSSSRIDVTWTDSTTNETAFRVEVSTDGSATWQSLVTLSPNTTAFADTSRSAEQQVCYRVVAIVDARESAPSGSDCTAPPAAPTRLAVAADTQAITLTWIDASNVEDGFAITRWPDGDQTRETLIGEVGANATSYRDSGVQAGVNYSYRVRPKKDGGYGSYSGVVTAVLATPPPPPPPGPASPSKLVASIDAGMLSISITWQDNSSDEDGFILEALASPTWSWRSSGPLPPNTTSVRYNLWTTAEQPIEYRVSAFNKDGTSTSNLDTAWVLNAPQAVAATVVDDHTVDITWINNSRYASTVEILRGPTSAGPFAVIGIGSGGRYRDAGLSQATYWYMLRVHVADSFSEAAYTFATTAPAPPNAVTSFRAYPWGSTTLLGEWPRARTNETGFRIEESPDGSGNWAATAIESDFQWHYFSTPTVPEQQRCFRVIAFNTYGDAPPSNAACTAAPATPIELAAQTTDAGVELRWTDNSGVEDGYWVLRSLQQDEYGNDFWEVIGQVRANVTTFRDTISSAILGYALYTVQAVKDGGAGDSSEPVGVPLPLPPASGMAVTTSRRPVPHAKRPPPLLLRRAPPISLQRHP